MLTLIYLIVGILMIIIAIALKHFSISFIKTARNNIACQQLFHQLWITYLIIGAIGIILGVCTLFGLLIPYWISIIYIVIILITSMIFGIRLMKQI